MTTNSFAHILILPSEWVSGTTPLGGIFIKRQAVALGKVNLRVGVVYIEPRSLRTLSTKSLRENYFQTERGEEDRISTVRQKGWNFGITTRMGGWVYAHLMANLVNKYIKTYGRPDIVHAHNALWGGYCASIVKRRLDIPYVLTEHSSSFTIRGIPKELQRFVRHAYENCETLIAVSPFLRAHMTSYAKTREIDIIPNVVDTDMFKPSVSLRHNNDFRYLAIGNLNHNKGFHVLIDAFAKVASDDPNVRLTIGGAGDQYRKLLQLADDLGIRNQITFAGLLSTSGVIQLMHSSDVFVLSSFKETFGIVLIEALAVGLPVIASRCGGPESFITPGVGLLFDCGDSMQLARAMKSVKTMTFDKNYLRNYVIENFSDSVVAQKLLEMYRCSIK